MATAPTRRDVAFPFQLSAQIGQLSIQLVPLDESPQRQFDGLARRGSVRESHCGAKQLRIDGRPRELHASYLFDFFAARDDGAGFSVPPATAR